MANTKEEELKRITKERDELLKWKNDARSVLAYLINSEDGVKSIIPKSIYEDLYPYDKEDKIEDLKETHFLVPFKDSRIKEDINITKFEDVPDTYYIIDGPFKDLVLNDDFFNNEDGKGTVIGRKQANKILPLTEEDLKNKEIMETFNIKQ